MTDLVGVAEIADRLTVSTDTVHKWHSRYDDFPEPVTRLRAALIWSWPDVAAWANATGRS